jgi:hypothetical protein
MPFEKGQTGNPHGRGAKKLQQKRLAADLLSPHVKRAVQVIAAQLDSDDPSWACKMIFEYVFGKPGQSVELSAKGDTPMTAVLMIGTKPDDR